MKKIIAFALALVIALAAPSVALAKGGKGHKAGKPFGGKVTAVDTQANTITVDKKKGKQEKIFNAANATITVDGTTGSLANITPGMHVKVTVGSTPGTASSIVAPSHKKGAGKHKKNGGQ